MLLGFGLDIGAVRARFEGGRGKCFDHLSAGGVTSTDLAFLLRGCAFALIEHEKSIIAVGFNEGAARQVIFDV